MRLVGRRTRANRAAHARDWPAILARQAHRCEGCGGTDGLQDAHLFGRPGSGACLGAVANHPALRTALCGDDPASGRMGCHARVDRSLDAPLRDRLRWAAFGRLWAASADEAHWAFASVLEGALLQDVFGNALDAIRALVRAREGRG